MKTPTFSQDALIRDYEFAYSQDGDYPTFVVAFSHCYANDVLEHEPKLTMWKDGEEFRVYPDAELAGMIQTYIENEGEEPDADWLHSKLDYKDVRNIGSILRPSEVVADATRRWQAIQLIVNPHVTINCHGHVHKGEHQ